MRQQHRLRLAGSLFALALFGLVPLGASGDAATNALEPVPMVGAPKLQDLDSFPKAPRVHWRKSKAIGLPYAGRLRRGVKLPVEGPTFFTWDPIRETVPNRGWRRWGTDELIRTMLRVARKYKRRHPDAPRLTIGDLSRPHGGDFGPQYGEIGHASHQNGLDVDIYYPRRDREEKAPRVPSQVDVRLSQQLVDMFVRAGAQKVFVGPSLDLHGPKGVVMPLVHHDNHLHVRLPAERP